MNEPVAVPTNRLEILHPVGTAMGAVPTVMDLQRSPEAAARAAAAMLLESHGTVQVVHAIDDRPQSQPLYMNQTTDRSGRWRRTQCAHSALLPTGEWKGQLPYFFGNISRGTLAMARVK
jgi:hypothetical protein